LFKLADYEYWNHNGLRSFFLKFLGLLFGVGKRASSRSLILMVSMGWGIAKHSIGKNYYFVVLLGVAYCMVSGTHDIMSNLEPSEFSLNDDHYQDTAR